MLTSFLLLFRSADLYFSLSSTNKIARPASGLSFPSTMINYKVRDADVKHWTEYVSTCRHPDKGRMAFARRNIAKEEVLGEVPMNRFVFPS